MPYLAGRAIEPTFAPFLFFEKSWGFVPALFRAQTLLPRVVEAEAGLAGAVLDAPSTLSRVQKERIVLTVASALGNAYCVTAHGRVLASLGDDEEVIAGVIQSGSYPGMTSAETALHDYALRLAWEPSSIRREHVESLRRAGADDLAILDAVLATAMARLFCALSAGLGVEPDVAPPSCWSGNAPARPRPSRASSRDNAENDEYLPRDDRDLEAFAPFKMFREKLGFVPRIYSAQTLRRDVVTAESEAVRLILMTEEPLSRLRKECIALVVSALNLNTYGVALHSEVLRALGVDDDQSERIALDHHEAGLPAEETALLDFALKLARTPQEMRREDVKGLAGRGFSEAEALDAVATVGLTQFLNTVQMGLGVPPDFPPRLIFPSRTDDFRELPEAGVDPTLDADVGLVQRLKTGDPVAYETLVREHGRRMYRTLMGILGRAEEAEDALQVAFLRVFKNVGSFRGESRFSTWLTRIAINEGLQRLRQRRPMESLDDTDDRSQEELMRDVRAWDENPEQAYSRAQVRSLVERELVGLPPAYRLAVTLRDLEQLSTEEAAAALSIPVNTLKTRLFRGRLMLREALAPHFRARDRGASRA